GELAPFIRSLISRNGRSQRYGLRPANSGTLLEQVLELRARESASPAIQALLDFAQRLPRRLPSDSPSLWQASSSHAPWVGLVSTWRRAAGTEWPGRPPRLSYTS